MSRLAINALSVLLLARCRSRWGTVFSYIIRRLTDSTDSSDAAGIHDLDCRRSRAMWLKWLHSHIVRSLLLITCYRAISVERIKLAYHETSYTYRTQLNEGPHSCTSTKSSLCRHQRGRSKYLYPSPSPSLIVFRHHLANQCAGSIMNHFFISYLLRFPACHVSSSPISCVSPLTMFLH